MFFFLASLLFLTCPFCVWIFTKRLRSLHCFLLLFFLSFLFLLSSVLFIPDLIVFVCMHHFSFILIPTVFPSPYSSPLLYSPSTLFCSLSTLPRHPKPILRPGETPLNNPNSRLPRKPLRRRASPHTSVWNVQRDTPSVQRVNKNPRDPLRFLQGDGGRGAPLDDGLALDRHKKGNRFSARSQLPCLLFVTAFS